MSRTKVVLYKDEDGSVPVRQWLRTLKPRALAKCLVKIERLQECGHELRRPEADLLRDGIYELRVRWESVNYRMLYFFYGTTAAVVSHGIEKEAAIPAAEIDLAIRRKESYLRDPDAHTDAAGI